jgi:RND family efflux transporter MFP subunit
MLRHHGRTGTCGVFVVLSAVALPACTRAQVELPPPPPTVRTSVVSASAEPPLAVRGPVVAGSRLRLGFKTPGVVKAILVKDGEAVRKGQVLARLDSADASANARAAQAVRDRAKREWQRSVKLADEGALASSSREDAKSTLDGAEASLAVAWEALKGMQLTSPVSGTVFKRMAEPGETVGAGAPVLIVDETQRPVVKLGVTDRDLKRLKKDLTATLIAEDTGASLRGVISTLSATPDSADGLYAVEVTPSARGAGKPGGKVEESLRLGTLVTVQFETATQQAIRIPLEALVHRNDKEWVFVVENAPAPIARIRAVGIGRSEGRDVVVSKGLTGGERIITEGAYFLLDGQTVCVRQ